MKLFLWKGPIVYTIFLTVFLKPLRDVGPLMGSSVEVLNCFSKIEMVEQGSGITEVTLFFV